MIIYLRVLSNEDEGFVEEIAIDDTASFADLHACIQHANNYDATQMASFFTTDKEWNKETEITLFDMSEGSNASLKVMEDTLVSDFLYEEGQRLLYVFDFFSERAFFMELIQVAEGTLNKANCYRKEGEAPDQIKMEDLSDDLGLDDDDLFGDEFDGSLDSLNFEDLDTDLNLDDYADQY